MRTLLLAIVAFVLIGCSTTEPEIKYYANEVSLLGKNVAVYKVIGDSVYARDFSVPDKPKDKSPIDTSKSKPTTIQESFAGMFKALDNLNATLDKMNESEAPLEFETLKWKRHGVVDGNEIRTFAEIKFGTITIDEEQVNINASLGVIKLDMTLYRVRNDSITNAFGEQICIFKHTKTDGE